MPDVIVETPWMAIPKAARLAGVPLTTLRHAIKTRRIDALILPGMQPKVRVADVEQLASEIIQRRDVAAV